MIEITSSTYYFDGLQIIFIIKLCSITLGSKIKINGDEYIVKFGRILRDGVMEVGV